MIQRPPGRNPAFTLGWLGPYLTHRLGVPVHADSLEKFGRGSSRETWFGRYRRSAAGAPIDITLRTDPPGGSTDPTPLEQEHFVYERLGGAGLPVAKVLWWEAVGAWTDRPFYVREKLAGDWKLSCFSSNDPAEHAQRVAVAQQHVEVLARIHALDWRALGFAERLAAPTSLADPAFVSIAGAAERLAQTDGEAVPIFTEACEWLAAHAPVATRLCLCKGTNGLGEEIFRDGRLVGLSDWEEVSIGDPASDFAFMQSFADPIVDEGRQVWGLEQALEHYRAAGGVRIAVESVRYYQVIRALTLVVMARNAATITHRTRHATIRQAWTGTEVLHIAKHVLASAMGLLPPPVSSIFSELNLSVEMV